jgi:hypothetical protein
LLPYARPPHGFFWQYLSKKSSYKTGARTQLGVRIRRILLSHAVPYLPRSHRHRHPFGRTGGPTDEGSGGATISNGAMMKVTAARRRRQNRRCNDEGSGGASMKLAAA